MLIVDPQLKKIPWQFATLPGLFVIASDCVAGSAQIVVLFAGFWLI